MPNLPTSLPFKADNATSARKRTRRVSKPRKQDSEHSYPALLAAMDHPLYKPGLPIAEQPEAVEEVWWAHVLAERGLVEG